MMQFRNARRNPSGSFNCEIHLPGRGWVPHTARLDDPDTQALAAKLKEYGTSIPMADAEPEVAVDLTPRQFEWLLAYTGYDETWDAVTRWLRDNDRELYADLQSERSRESFQLDRVHAILGRPDVAAVLTAVGHDIDMARVDAAWPVAAGK